MRAFIVGFPKSGTSTLQTAFEKSGIRSVHWQCAAGYVGKVIYESHFAGLDPLINLNAFEAVTQADVCLPQQGVSFWPNLDFNILGAIRRHHPDCLFILNWREPAATVASIVKWGDLQERLTISDIPGLPRGFGGETAHLVRWIEGHYQAARIFFKGTNFLEVDIASEDAPAKVGAALGTPIVWWGRANASPAPADDASSPSARATPR